VRVDGDLLFTLGIREGVRGGRPRRRSDAASRSELLAPVEELGALALDRGRVRFTGAHEIAHIRLGGGETVSDTLGIAARTLRRGEALFGIFSATLGIGTLREDLALRFFSGEELLVKAGCHCTELSRRVAVGPSARLDQPR